MNDNYVKKILNQPNAQLIINKVKEELILEEQKRHAFYEWIDEDTKAEFINGQIDLHSPSKKSRGTVFIKNGQYELELKAKEGHILRSSS